MVQSNTKSLQYIFNIIPRVLKLLVHYFEPATPAKDSHKCEMHSWCITGSTDLLMFAWKIMNSRNIYKVPLI